MRWVKTEGEYCFGPPSPPTLIPPARCHGAVGANHCTVQRAELPMNPNASTRLPEDVSLQVDGRVRKRRADGNNQGRETLTILLNRHATSGGDNHHSTRNRIQLALVLEKVCTPQRASVLAITDESCAVLREVQGPDEPYPPIAPWTSCATRRCKLRLTLRHGTAQSEPDRNWP